MTFYLVVISMSVIDFSIIIHPISRSAKKHKKKRKREHEEGGQASSEKTKDAEEHGKWILLIYEVKK